MLLLLVDPAANRSPLVLPSGADDSPDGVIHVDLTLTWTSVITMNSLIWYQSWATWNSVFTYLAYPDALCMVYFPTTTSICSWIYHANGVSGLWHQTLDLSRMLSLGNSIPRQLLVDSCSPREDQQMHTRMMGGISGSWRYVNLGKGKQNNWLIVVN